MLDQYPKIAIYGAGNNCNKLINLLGAEKIAYILDANQSGQMQGIPIHKFSEVNWSSLELVPVLISIFNRAVDLTQFKPMLLEKNFPQVLNMLDISEELDGRIDLFWGNDVKTEPTAEEKEKVFAILGDEKSKKVFEEFLEFRRSGGTESQCTLESGPQYLEKELFDFSSIKRIIDCGAFDGDTLNDFSQACPVEAYVAFEPDPKNYMPLASRGLEFEQIKNLSLLPCGVWSSIDQLSFSADGEAGQIVGADSKTQDTVVIQCVSIDEALPHFTPDLIKMDIEGAEDEALKGARKTIQKDKPILTLSLYHRPTDFWTLILQINEMNPDYRFYLRTYMYNYFDTVVFAI